MKKSKTDIKYIRLEIIIATINNISCSISAFHQLFIFDSQPSNAPLFKYDNGVAFACKPIILILCLKLEVSGILCQAYSDHSFCKNAAQHVFNNNI